MKGREVCRQGEGEVGETSVTEVSRISGAI